MKGIFRGLVWAVLALVFVGMGRAEEMAATAGEPNLDFGVRTLACGISSPGSVAGSAGFPRISNLWWLCGGGAALTPGNVRLQISAWTGEQNASAGTRSSHWELNMATLNLEQAYPSGNFLLTAGAGLDGAELDGNLTDGSAASVLYAPLWGYELNAGVRWPAKTLLGLYFRVGYEWLSGSGSWRGDQASVLGNSDFNLGGISSTLQFELGF